MGEKRGAREARCRWDGMYVRVASLLSATRCCLLLAASHRLRRAFFSFSMSWVGSCGFLLAIIHTPQTVSNTRTTLNSVHIPTHIHTSAMSSDDDWENDDAPVLAPTVFKAPTAQSAPLCGDDEEDLTLLQKPEVSAPSESQQAAARKKAQLEEEALASRIEFAKLENETPEERKIRERRQAEEAEARMMTGDLGGVAVEAPTTVSAARGIAAIPVKTREEHKDFALTVANKLSNSTAICTTAFMTDLTNKLQKNMTIEGLDALLVTLKATRDARKKAVKVDQRKTKKELRQEDEEHGDKYGRAQKDEVEAYYDSYSQMEDDFF